MEPITLRRGRARMLSPTTNRGEINAALRTAITVPSTERYLWRLDRQTVTVEWDAESEWDAQIREVFAPAQREPISISLTPGSTLSFSLDTRPSYASREAGKTRGVRRYLHSPSDRRQWLLERLEPCGSITLDSAIEITDGAGRFTRFVGSIVVVDPLAMAEQITSGIGHEKSTGFGLLLCAPAAW